ncbi:MAG: NUDIX hydrolase [Gammaproteobacteria bacterium]|nr:NUDIX hydrolase [Gammaproteobacteria bacterium]
MTAKQSVEPKPSATIMLLRDGAHGMEVFMVVRHHEIDFASGALVFPGGKADAQDFDETLLPYLHGNPSDPNQRALQVSAIREAFEECGILLARPMNGEHIISAQRLAQLQPFRVQLNDGSLSLLDFLEQQQLQLACDTLVHFAHWITPEMMPKRFDTHFYLAMAPHDHLAVHDGYESVDSIWITPAQVEADAQTGQRTVIFPTLLNIQKLGLWQSSAQALQAAKEAIVVPVLPWMERREEGNFVCIPAEAGYLVSEQKVPAKQSQ